MYLVLVRFLFFKEKPSNLGAHDATSDAAIVVVGVVVRVQNSCYCYDLFDPQIKCFRFDRLFVCLHV